MARGHILFNFDALLSIVAVCFVCVNVFGRDVISLLMRLLQTATIVNDSPVCRLLSHTSESTDWWASSILNQFIQNDTIWIVRRDHLVINARAYVVAMYVVAKQKKMNNI